MATSIFYIVALVAFMALLWPLPRARIVLAVFLVFMALGIAHANGRVSGSRAQYEFMDAHLRQCEQRLVALAEQQGGH